MASVSDKFLCIKFLVSSMCTIRYVMTSIKCELTCLGTYVSLRTASALSVGSFKISYWVNFPLHVFYRYV